VLICAMNAGEYGSEFHKLRAEGLDDSDFAHAQSGLR
jgi:hypothetical protein